MWQTARDIFIVRYEKWKCKNESSIGAVIVASLAAVMFLLGWMISRWPKGQWPRR